MDDILIVCVYEMSNYVDVTDMVAEYRINDKISTVYRRNATDCRKSYRRNGFNINHPLMSEITAVKSCAIPFDTIIPYNRKGMSSSRFVLRVLDDKNRVSVLLSMSIRDMCHAAVSEDSAIYMNRYAYNDYVTLTKYPVDTQNAGSLFIYLYQISYRLYILDDSIIPFIRKCQGEFVNVLDVVKVLYFTFLKHTNKRSTLASFKYVIYHPYMLAYINVDDTWFVRDTVDAYLLSIKNTITLFDDVKLKGLWFSVYGLCGACCMKSGKYEKPNTHLPRLTGGYGTLSDRNTLLYIHMRFLMYPELLGDWCAEDDIRYIRSLTKDVYLCLVYVDDTREFGCTAMAFVRKIDSAIMLFIDDRDMEDVGDLYVRELYSFNDAIHCFTIPANTSNTLRKISSCYWYGQIDMHTTSCSLQNRDITNDCLESCRQQSRDLFGQISLTPFWMESDKTLHINYGSITKDTAEIARVDACRHVFSRGDLIAEVRWMC